MKCNHCQAEWTVNAAMSASIKSCPFCGKPIAVEPDDKLGSMSAALKAIIAHSGIDGLRDGKRALAMFSDLAPQLRREKIMFSYFIQCEGNTILIDALKKSRPEQIVSRGKIAQQMIRDLLVNEDVAYEACDAFWDAIGGSPLIDTKQIPQEAPTKTLSSEEFWHKLVAAVKQDIEPPAAGFFTTSPTAPLQGKLVGDCVELHCSNSFTVQSIAKDEVLDAVIHNASEILGRPIRVCVKSPQSTIEKTNPSSAKKPTGKPAFVPPPPPKPMPKPTNNPTSTATKYITPSVPPRPSVTLPEKKRTPSELYQEGLKFEKGYAAPKNLALAVQLYTESAKQGYADAMFALGELYATGTGVEQDWNEAYLWYQRASEKGHVRAMLQLGICNKEGLGTRKNAVEALRWIRSAAAKGDTKAQYMLSTSSELVAPGQKASNYEQAAKAGNPDAQYSYAKCYATASGGVTRNYTLAADYYERAAKQGHSRAQFAIAEMYEKGQGVMVSLSKAEEYYRMAAQSSDADIARQAAAALRHFQKQSPTPTPVKKEEPTPWFKKMFGRG